MNVVSCINIVMQRLDELNNELDLLKRGASTKGASIKDTQYLIEENEKMLKALHLHFSFECGVNYTKKPESEITYEKYHVNMQFKPYLNEA